MLRHFAGQGTLRGGRGTYRALEALDGSGGAVNLTKIDLAGGRGHANPPTVAWFGGSLGRRQPANHGRYGGRPLPHAEDPVPCAERQKVKWLEAYGERHARRPAGAESEVLHAPVGP